MADVAARMLAELAVQSRQIQQHEELAQRYEREIQFKDAKLEKVSFELVRLKAWKFGARTERMNAQQRQMFEDTAAEDEATLDEVLGKAVKGFLHEYDFGDGWHHEVTVQAGELADEQRNSWPMCLAGANACPPEDVGGLGGYADFLQAISDPSHEELDAMWRWCGGPFDPKGFDINSANRAIREWLADGL